MSLRELSSDELPLVSGGDYCGDVGGGIGGAIGMEYGGIPGASVGVAVGVAVGQAVCGVVGNMFSGQNLDDNTVSMVAGMQQADDAMAGYNSNTTGSDFGDQNGPSNDDGSSGSDGGEGGDGGNGEGGN